MPLALTATGGLWSAASPSVDPRQAERGAAAQVEGVVDPVGLGDAAPRVRIAVGRVGHGLERVAVLDDVDAEAAGERVVGFWPLFFDLLDADVAVSAWVSASLTSARIGVPLGWNSWKATVSEVQAALKGIISPHWNVTSGGTALPAPAPLGRP